MNTAPQNPDAFDQELQATLERKPAVAVSPDFAARVAARAAAQPLPKPRRVTSYGSTAAILSAVFLLVAMFALVPWTQPGFGSFAFDIELFAAAQLIAIAWWLTAHRRT